ncbi:hypothetical protein P353_18060 [Comamonas testosteroni]|uniref:Uncharacterized protein n=1 Tax=Comamonas testosteroni TaxID=285 RepID=A0A096FB26_COMTE|nr:hypothetical protein P353_18060 [Comamonas testosteroni]
MLFLLAGLATLRLFDVLGLLVDLAIEHAGRQRFCLGHESHDPLTGDGLDQRAMSLAARCPQPTERPCVAPHFSKTVFCRASSSACRCLCQLEAMQYMVMFLNIRAPTKIAH